MAVAIGHDVRRMVRASAAMRKRQEAAEERESEALAAAIGLDIPRDELFAQRRTEAVSVGVGVRPCR